MVTTNSYDLWQRMWSYKDHGKNYDSVYRPSDKLGFRWLHDRFGTNWRLSEVQSAVGRVALRKLPGWLAARRSNAARLTERLSQTPGLRAPTVPEHMGHAYYKYYVYVEPKALAQGWDRDRVCQAIASRGIPCGTGSCSEIYLEDAFPHQWRPRNRYTIARQLGETSLMFLVHPTLAKANIDNTCEVVRQVMSQATRATSRAAVAGA
jgi:dTDP-4-amino-4,6-dideoxygalactose transaminase